MNRNKYSSAPTYGMQKRQAAKKPPQPQMPQQAYPPAGQMPYGPGSPQMPPQAGYEPYGGAASQPYMPQQPAYAAQPYGYAPGQPAYPPRQQAPRGPMVQHPVIPPQPMPYPPQQPYAAQPLPQEYAVRQARPRNDGWLQICVLGVLPALFILTLLIALPLLKWAFVILAAICVLAMWLQQSFVFSARSTLTLVYGALILVSIVSIITSAPKGKAVSTQQGNVSNGNMVSSSSPTQAPSNVIAAGNNGDTQTAANGGDTQTAPPETTPAPSQNDGADSQAWKQLDMFFNFWQVNDTPSMVQLVAPSWASTSEKPAQDLFFLLANRTPLEHAFESITGSEDDTSRTITMTALIDKGNGSTPVKLRYSIIMLRENNTWYVDPKSLTTNSPVSTATPADGSGQTTSGDGTSQSAATPTPAPDAKTKLYFNEAGGKYYHAVKDCQSVNKKYLPLTSFYYRDLNKTDFKNLLPCPQCNAPNRP